MRRVTAVGATAARGGGVRRIVLPKQVSAYAGQEFNPSRGDRAGQLEPHRTLFETKNIQSSRRTQCLEAFDDMALSPVVQDALGAVGITVPSPVQQMAIAPIKERKPTLVAAPSGSGKTAACLAPLFDMLLSDRDVHKVPLREHRPRAILLAPTQELCQQIAAVCERMGETTGLKTVCFTSRPRMHRTWRRVMQKEMPDILVLHPALALRQIECKRLLLDDLRHVYVDEADTLVGASHDRAAAKLLQLVHKRRCYKHLWPARPQPIFSTASVTKELLGYVEKRQRGALSVIARGTHVAPPKARQRFYTVRETHKLDVLRYVLQRGGNKPAEWAGDEGELRQEHDWTPLPGEGLEADEAQTEGLVPISAEEENAGADSAGPSPAGGSCDAVAAALRAHDSPVPHHDPAPIVWEHLRAASAPFTCAVPREVRIPGERVVVFFRSIDRCTAIYHHLHRLGFKVALMHGSLPHDVRREHFARWASGQCNILCATDIAARGLDLQVDRVVNFDFPTNPIEYLARVGRTARMGRTGKVSSLVTKKQRTLAAVMRQFTAKGLPAEGVSNWYRHMTNPRYAEWRTHRINATARKFVSLITKRTIPHALEKTYLRHQATWRPLHRPRQVGTLAGIPAQQQAKVSARVHRAAIDHRKAQMAVRKGGAAKFGRAHRSGTWTHTGVSNNMTATFAGSAPGLQRGVPHGPPK